MAEPRAKAPARDQLKAEITIGAPQDRNGPTKLPLAKYKASKDIDARQEAQACLGERRPGRFYCSHAGNGLAHANYCYHDTPSACYGQPTSGT